MTGVLGAYGSETGIWLHLLYPLAAGRVNRLDANRGRRAASPVDMRLAGHTTPWAIIASATFMKPAMLAPMT